MEHAEVSVMGEEGWRLGSAEVVESLCTACTIVADIEHDSGDIDAAAMPGQWISLSIPSLVPERPRRYVGGVITRWEQTDSHVKREGGSVYRVHAASPIELMSLRRQTRQFNHKSVLEICSQLFDEWGDRIFASLSGAMMVTDQEPSSIQLQHARQVRESDLQFVRRLLNQAGVFTMQTYTGPAADDSTLQLGTFSRAASPWADSLAFQYQPVGESVQFDHQISRWQKEANLGPTIPVIATWHGAVADNHLPSNASVMATSPSSPSFHGWEYIDHTLGAPRAGMRMTELRDGLSKVREQALAIEYAWRHGLSTSAAIVPGCSINPQGLPHDDAGPFFVTASRLIVLGESYSQMLDLDMPVRCAFTAIPLHTPFRPPSRLERLEPPDRNQVELAQALDRLVAQEMA